MVVQRHQDRSGRGMWGCGSRLASVRGRYAGGAGATGSGGQSLLTTIPTMATGGTSSQASPHMPGVANGAPRVSGHIVRHSSDRASVSRSVLDDPQIPDLALGRFVFDLSPDQRLGISPKGPLELLPWQAWRSDAPRSSRPLDSVRRRCSRAGPGSGLRGLALRAAAVRCADLARAVVRRQVG